MVLFHSDGALVCWYIAGNAPTATPTRRYLFLFSLAQQGCSPSQLQVSANVNLTEFLPTTIGCQLDPFYEIRQLPTATSRCFEAYYFIPQDGSDDAAGSDGWESISAKE